MDNEQNPPAEPALTEQELKDLGSAEWSAMTFTPPGGTAMTLDEYARHQQQQAREREANLAILQQHNEDEARRRREMRDMRHEERVAYIEAENEKIGKQSSDQSQDG